MASQRGGIPGLEGISDMFDDIFDDEDDEEEISEQSLLPFGVGGGAKEIHSNLPFGIGSRPASGPTEILIPHDPALDDEPEPEPEPEPELEPEPEVHVEEERIVEEFKKFDSDESGSISIAEIAEATGLDEVQAEVLHAQIDTDGDGEVDLEEFKQASQIKSLAERLGIPMIKARPIAEKPQPVVETPEPIPEISEQEIPDDESPESVLLGSSASSVFSPPKLHGEELLALYEEEDDVVDYRHDEEFSSIVEVEHTNGSIATSDSPQSLELHPAKAMVVQASIETRELIRNGFSQMSSGDWKSAGVTFQRLAQHQPSDSAVLNNLGLCFLQLALTEQGANANAAFENSITSLRNAAKSNPSEETILINLSQALLLSDRSDKALRVIEAVLQRNSGNCEALNLHAAILYNLGRVPEAKRSLGIIAEIDEVIMANKRLLQVA